jgi:phenylacetate-coenzyme A ligase PaaK-like adenylate-forming protein
MHYIENHAWGAKNDFLITTLDRTIISPRVRYAVQDEGGVISFKDVIRILQEHEPEATEAFLKKNRKILRLPVLYVRGRSDGTISLDGANVYPQQIELCLMKSDDLLCKTNHYMIARDENKNGQVVFKVFIELRNNIGKSVSLKKRYQQQIGKVLPLVNSDYKESLLNNEKLSPKVTLFRQGTGPFKDNGEMIKLKRIAVKKKKK